MKHIFRYLAIICILQGSFVKADHHNLQQSFVQQSSSSQQVSTQQASQGGTVTINGQTFQTEPGQTVSVQGGGVTTHTQTTKVGGQPAVTVTEVEKRPLTVTVDGQTTTLDDSGSTSVTIDGEPIDMQEPDIVRRTGEVTAQAARDTADVAVQTTEGVVDTIGNFFGGLFGR